MKLVIMQYKISQPMKVIITILLCTNFISGCSNRAIYESLRRANLQACEQQPIALIEVCKESNRVSYDEYRREIDRLSTSN